MNTYLVTCIYPGSGDKLQHTTHSELPIDEFVEEQAECALVRKLVRVALVQPELECLHDVISAQLLLWQRMRELEKAVGQDLDDVAEFIEAAAVGVDEPMSFLQYEQLCGLMAQVREDYGLPPTDYSKDVREL